MKKTITIIKAALFLVILIMFTSFLFAVPSGPSSINESTAQTRGAAPPVQLNAEAGNITAINIVSTSATRSWQGYYGNITGAITLDDASNYTMYDWVLSSPQGEIYASNSSSVTWIKVKCVNYTAPTTGNGSEMINLSVLESMFGMNSDDVDGVDETFNATYSDAAGFYVGDVHINVNDSCPMTYMYVNESYQMSRFKEILLTDNVSIIFTALLEEDFDDYKPGSETSDFQLIVGEDEHPTGSGETTPYYFFAELE
ncbi:hypothetical protein KY366_02720 [Candidatus Woesearchaeota archaeon]|nr:hypothetical protein [Candidatus Woesearchaeota archaeon]